jgi:hypothetical protein
MITARGKLGDAVRRNEERIRAERSLGHVAHAIGVSREFLYRVLAGDEWSWPRGRRFRPPGARLPDTPVTVLASYMVDGHYYALVSYRDTADAKCVGVDRDGEPWAALSDVQGQ